MDYLFYILFVVNHCGSFGFLLTESCKKTAQRHSNARLFVGWFLAIQADFCFVYNNKDELSSASIERLLLVPCHGFFLLVGKGRDRDSKWAKRGAKRIMYIEASVPGPPGRHQQILNVEFLESKQRSLKHHHL